MDPLAIRDVAISDAAAVARLSGELGYPAPVIQMESRIAQVLESSDHAAFVACLGGEVAGWIHIAVVHHLQAETRVEIGGLVVADGFRGRGMGQRLVLRAEQWAAQKNITSVVVRSQIAREAAHRFYLREGYTQTKTSAVFTKVLS